MVKGTVWTATLVLIALLVWQLVVDADPIVLRAMMALLLAVVCFMAGLRVGADSAAAYIEDLQRLNKLMADQQRDLEEMNLMLLKRTDSVSDRSRAS